MLSHLKDTEYLNTILNDKNPSSGDRKYAFTNLIPTPKHKNPKEPTHVERVDEHVVRGGAAVHEAPVHRQGVDGGRGRVLHGAHVEARGGVPDADGRVPAPDQQHPTGPLAGGAEGQHRGLGDPVLVLDGPFLRVGKV